jgi:excisionase family DNA binding protein
MKVLDLFNKYLAETGDKLVAAALTTADLIKNAETMLTPPEAARLLRVNPDKILRWIHSGELPAINVANSLSTRPIFRIAPQALNQFRSYQQEKRGRPRRD